MQAYNETTAATKTLKVLLQRKQLNYDSKPILSIGEQFDLRKVMFSKGFSAESVQAALDLAQQEAEPELFGSTER